MPRLVSGCSLSCNSLPLTVRHAVRPHLWELGHCGRGVRFGYSTSYSHLLLPLDTMSSDTELDVGPSCSRRAGNTPTARAVESLSECGDMVCMTEQHVRELVSSFEELEVNQFLPDGCVRLVAESLANDPNSLLSLLAMCGTCRQWRQVAAELGGEGTLSFDSMESQWAGMPLAQRFRKASPAVKETVFASAAQLFSGKAEGRGLSHGRHSWSWGAQVRRGAAPNDRPCSPLQATPMLPSRETA